MPVETLTAIPSSLIAGDTTIVQLGFTDYPATLWTLDLVLNRDGSPLKKFTATADGTDFLLTFTAAGTSGLVPGSAQVFLSFTEIATSQRVSQEASPIMVRPNPFATLPETSLQRKLRVAYEELERAGGSPGMVGANQMQVVSGDLEKKLRLCERLEVMVAKEKRDMGIASTKGKARTIVSVFR